jgi:glycosyltransferase involved in cell wall biosynthesis
VSPFDKIDQLVHSQTRLSNSVPQSFSAKVLRVMVDLDRLREPTSGLGHVALYFGERLARRAASLRDIRFTFLVPARDVGRFGADVDYVCESRWLKIFPFLHRHFDLWYCPHQDVAYSPVRGSKFIFTINDLNFLKEKSPARCRARLRRIQKFIDRASIVTTISENTAVEVRQHLQMRNVPLIVQPFGLELKTYEHVARPAFVPSRPFLLTVGVHKRTKNYRVLVDLMEQLPEFDLVMLGNAQTQAGLELKERLARSEARNRVHLLGVCSDEDKFWFYQHCAAVLFPSISEGMGYPPLEAMQVRRPVFVFRESAVPEICGPHALYWSSQQSEIMAQEVRAGLKWFHEHPEFADNAYVHGMSFSWDPVVDKYLALLRQQLELSA